jgi:uncharacterized membrane protein
MSTELPKPAQDYLRRLRHALASLPDSERSEVLAEITSHLADRQARGDADLLSGFEAPEEYAAQFVAERALVDALARGASWQLGRSLLIGKLSTFASYLAVAALWFLHATGYLFLVLAALKPFFASSIGVFVGNEVFAVGAYSGSPGAREVLGFWAISVFVGAAAVLMWVSNRALRALARRRLRARAS